MSKQRHKRPREPAPSECCGSGCSRCVWDVYFDDLAKYEENVTDGNAPENEDEEENIFDSFSEDDSCESHNYVGSVVFRHVEAPTTDSGSVTPSVAVSTILGRVLPVHNAQVVLSSCTYSFDADSLNEAKEEQAIQIVNVQLGSEREFVEGKDNAVDEVGTEATVLPLPGDVVEVFVPNDHDISNSGRCGEVEMLCERLGLDPDQWCEIYRSPFVPADNFPFWLPLRRRIQIRTLLAYFVDIGSCSYLLRPTFLQTLLRLATSSKTTPSTALPKQAIGSFELLEKCASTEMAPFVYKRIMNGGTPLCFPRLIDILNVFSFIKLPIARLLEISGPLRPRRFSVVNYTAATDGAAGKKLRSVELCLRRVDVRKMAPVNFESDKNDAVHLLAQCLHSAISYRLGAGSNNDFLFTGHVSHQLCNFSLRQHALPVYVGTRLFGATRFARGLMESLMPLVSHTPVVATHPPLILLGAGTGIAPLISAVYELIRHHQSSSGLISSNTDCWVVYGARNSAELVYHRQLEEALKLRLISRYDVALSRSSGGTCPRYVTDVLESHVEKVRSALLDRGGRLFACGPSAFLTSLRQRLADRILAFENDDESEREHRVLFLEKKGQIMFDVWNTANIFV